jgi:hypothetical protein
MTAYDKIRAALEAAAEYPNSVYAALKAENAMPAIAELETELSTLRARLAAIDAAPTVAVIDEWRIPGYIRASTASDDLLPYGTQLIARPEAK